MLSDWKKSIPDQGIINERTNSQEKTQCYSKLIRLVSYLVVCTVSSGTGQADAERAVHVWARCREELSFHLKLHASHPPHLAPTTTTDISPHRNDLPELRYTVKCNILLH